MAPHSSSFKALNLPPSFTLPQDLECFTLPASPNTDLWRKPGETDISTAPILFTTLRNPFTLAEVTVNADWEMEWDQGGLVIFAGQVPTDMARSRVLQQQRQRQRTTTTLYNDNFHRLQPLCKWVRAGVQFNGGAATASSATATSVGADWSLSALPVIPGARGTGTVSSLRIKLERVGDSLWIWHQIPMLSPYAIMTPGAVSSTWKKMREVTGFFYGVAEKNVHVGVYAGRPSESIWATMDRTVTATDSDKLVVEFEDLEIL